MRYIGLLGGTSWASTVEYYGLINRRIAARMGGRHAAKILLHSVDVAEIDGLRCAEAWEDAAAILADAAVGLERGGAEAIVLCANTMHRVAPAIETALGVPLLHIVDPAGHALQAAGIRRAALLGTRYTMEEPFWRDRLADGFGVELRVPGAADRQLIHRVIHDELCHDECYERSRAACVSIIEQMAREGAEAVILGCTEIGILIRQSDVTLPLFDTTTLHAEAAASFALGAA
ncbi:MAG TPA: amino acid racemase [Gemmatimonadaceae bacterium]